MSFLLSFAMFLLLHGALASASDEAPHVPVAQEQTVVASAAAPSPVAPKHGDVPSPGIIALFLGGIAGFATVTVLLARNTKRTRRSAEFIESRATSRARRAKLRQDYLGGTPNHRR